MKKPVIVTHNGRFHTDELFAVATVLLANGDCEVVRTRDEKLIKNAEYCLDVGGVYDPEQNRFDHHQSEGAGLRENGIPYATFGLVWKHFGEQLCSSKVVAESVDADFVQPIDAIDNGVMVCTPSIEGVYPFTVGGVFSVFNSTWKEDDSLQDTFFMEAIVIAKRVIERKIQAVSDVIKAEDLVSEAYESADDKRLIIFNEYAPVKGKISEFAEPLYFIQPDFSNSTWRVCAVSKDRNTFENRKDFPVSWAGKRDKELVEITGVADALFCHRGRFICVAQSKEGALALAALALTA